MRRGPFTDPNPGNRCTRVNDAEGQCAVLMHNAASYVSTSSAGVARGSTSNRRRCSTTKSTGTANVKPADTAKRFS